MIRVMNNALIIILPIAGGIICAAIGALGTYMAMKRKNSGLIETSEAASLWIESTAIRKELRDENTTLRERVRNLEQDMSKRDEEIRKLNERITELEGRHGRKRK